MSELAGEFGTHAAGIDAAAAAVILVSLVFLARAAWRIIYAAPSRFAATAATIVAAGVFSGLVLTATRLALAAVAADFTSRAVFRLWPGVWRTKPASAVFAGSSVSPPTVEPERKAPVEAERKAPAIRWQPAAGYIALIVAAALLEPGDALARISQTLSAIVAAHPGWLAAAGWLTAAILLFPLRRLIVKSEISYANIVYASLFAGGLFCAALTLTRRPGFAALATLFAVAGLIEVSRLKDEYLRTRLHACEVIDFIGDFSKPYFLLRHMPAIAIPCLSAAAAGVTSLILAGLLEPAAIERAFALVGLLLVSTALLATRPFLASRNLKASIIEQAHITNFLESIPEAVETYRRGCVLKTHPVDGSAPALRVAPAPGLRRSPPNIIVILNESTFPPCLFWPQQEPAIADFFRSIDGRQRQLRVETYGGFSWMTEFSLLTGIPANSYGPFRSQVFRWATGQIKHSLPACLRQHGYRSASIYPLSQEFVGTGDFYRSIGFDEIVDRSMLRAESEAEPDSFYHDQALNWLAGRFAASEQPLFLFLLTMSNHGPHDRSNCGAGSEPQDHGRMLDETAEYMRRLRLTCGDYARFRAQLAGRFPDREFLLVHFGDHQPSLTARFLEPAKRGGGSRWIVPPAEMAFQTYFAIDGVNFQPQVDGDIPDALEVAYLGTVILAAAGLPLDCVHALRRHLMIRHGGRLFFADADGQIAGQLNRRLIDAGLINQH